MSLTYVLNRGHLLYYY